MNILIVSNMGAKPSVPNQGGFVDNQVDGIRRTGKFNKVAYHNRSFNGDTLIYKIFSYPVFFISFFLRFVLSKEKYDVIHIHYYYPTIFCGLIYKLFRNKSCRLYVTCHGSDIYNFPNPNILYKKLSFYVDHWIFTSNLLKDKFYRVVDSYSILSAGYNEELYKPNSHVTKRYDFLMVGTYNKNKGLDRFIELAREFPDNCFALVGTGVMPNEFKVTLEQLNNVELLGSIEPAELVGVFLKSRFYLSLSRNESFGLVITEANALGVPCIATKTDGSSEQLSQWPLLVAQEGEKESVIQAKLTSMIKSALEKRDSEYNELSAQAQKLAEKYKLSSVIKELELIYTI